MTDEPVPLTSLAHGGGCGCKLSPALLREILAGMPMAGAFPELLVGTETADDAAVWRLNDSQALVATTDFFTPIVDDPFDFGRIAATNALSDVYAMGATPILALAIVGMPIARLGPERIRAILAGGASVCAAAGIPVAGGHSIDSAEPIYGLVALGLVHPGKLRRNSGGRAGDVLILTKPLGVGILSAALRQGRLDADGYRTLIEATTRLNAIGPALADLEAVHAITDVTGFGLLGHALEMAAGAGLTAELDAAPPLLDGVEAMVRGGVRTGASDRNWRSYAASIEFPDGGEAWRRDVLTDPQTSGGLLIAVSPHAAAAVVDLAAPGRLRRRPPGRPAHRGPPQDPRTDGALKPGRYFSAGGEPITGRRGIKSASDSDRHSAASVAYFVSARRARRHERRAPSLKSVHQRQHTETDMTHPIIKILAPTTATVTEGVATALSGLRLNERPQPGETFTETLTDTNGLLSAKAATGVSGNGTTTLTLTGKMGFILNELLTITDTAPVAGADTITITASDSLGRSAAPVQIAVTASPPAAFAGAPAFVSAMASHGALSAGIVVHAHESWSRPAMSLAVAR